MGRALRRVCVIGGGLGAASVCEGLAGKDLSIQLIGKEPYLPYDRPPLSKQFLKAVNRFRDPHALELHPADWYSQNGIEVSLCRRALSLSPPRADGTKVIRLSDGTDVVADDVVVATGSRARLIPFESKNVFYLRTVDDAIVLRERLRQPGQLLIIGAGFIGLEVAGSAVELGWRVTVVEKAEAPLARIFGAALGDLCVQSHRTFGVEVLTETGIASSTDAAAGVDVTLTPGGIRHFDAVVIGVGARPNVEWLQGSGVEVDDGIVCDPVGRTSVPGVWAVGDVARWPNAVTHDHVRVEQWQAARDHGEIVARAICGDPTAVGWDRPPYFWSDSFSSKTQFVGTAPLDVAPTVVEAGGRAIALFGHTELEGVLTISAPRAAAIGRRMVLARTSLGAAKEWALDELEGSSSKELARRDGTSHA